MGWRVDKRVCQRVCVDRVSVVCEMVDVPWLTG